MMTGLGEFPPIQIRRDRFLPDEIRYTLNLYQVRWADLDRQRHDPLMDGDSAAILVEQAFIETLQHKLKALL